MMSQARKWTPQAYTSSQWSTGAELDLNSDGYPTSLPSDQIVGTMLNRDVLMNGRSGEYTILYDGDGILTVILTSVKTVKRREKGRITVQVELTSDSNNGIFLQIVKTNPGDPVRNIRVVPTEALNYFNTFPFQPHYVNLHKEFDVIRFMDWTRTNSGFDLPMNDEGGSPNWLSWESRTLAGNSFSYTSKTGVPYELCCMFANAVDADMWLNIPHNADDNFILNLATLLHTNLRPELQIIVEYSNEAWGIVEDYGGLHSGGIWADAESQKDPHLSSHHCYVAKRMYEIRSLFIEAIGHNVVVNEERVKSLLASQAGSASVTGALLSCDIGGGLPLPWLWVDILAIAPYANGHLKSVYGSDAETDSWIPEAISEVAPLAIDQSLDMAQSSWEILSQYSVLRKNNNTSNFTDTIEYWQYEGGIHFTKNGDEPANWHPLMKDKYRDYFVAHSRRGAVLTEGSWNFEFDLVSQFGEYGSGGRNVQGGKLLSGWALVSSPFRVANWAQLTDGGEFYGNPKLEGLATYMRSRDQACEGQFAKMLGADEDDSGCQEGCGHHGYCSNPEAWPFNGTCVCDIGASGETCEYFKPRQKYFCGYHCGELSEPKLRVEYSVNGKTRSRISWKGECLPVENGTSFFAGTSTWLASEVQEIHTCQNCLPGFEGADCRLFECISLNFCSFRGTCLHPGIEPTDSEPYLVTVPGRCSCFRGFGGQDCSIGCGCIGKEDGLVHGECNASTYECVPDSGWERQSDALGLQWSCGSCQGKCEAPGVCAKSPDGSCSIHTCEWGQCFLGECHCWLGYHGKQCDQYVGDFSYPRSLPYGVNIGGLEYWSTTYPFVDIAPQQMRWISNARQGVYPEQPPWNDERPIEIKESGFPLSLLRDQVATTLINRNTVYRSPSGNYTILYNTDKAKVEYSMDALLLRSEFSQDVVNFDGTCAGPGATPEEEEKACLRLMLSESVYEGENGIGINIQGLWDEIAKRMAGNVITDGNVTLGTKGSDSYFHVIMPDFDSFSRWKHLPFHPLYLKHLEPFPVLRFHGWSDPSIPNVTRVGSGASVGDPIAGGDMRKWSNRIQKYHLRDSYGKHYHDRGVPFEYMIEKCNILGCSPWFVVGASVDDEYVKKLQELVSETLRPDVDAFIEYGNELWNPLYDGAQWCSYKGSDIGLTRFQYYAKRSVEICNIWRSISGNQRFKCILSGWSGSDIVNREILSHARSVLNTGSLVDLFDSFATTGYWDCGLTHNGAVNVQLSVSEMVTRCAANSQLQAFKDRMLQDKAVAMEFGMPLSTYEAGPSLVEYTAIHSGRSTDGYTQKLIELNRHSQMEQIYKLYSDIAVLQVNVTRWMQFVYQSGPSKYGSWGLQEYTGQYHPLPPKYSAILRSIQEAAPSNQSLSGGCMKMDTSMFGLGVGINSFVGPPFVFLKDVTGQARNKFKPGEILQLFWKSSVQNEASQDQKKFTATSVRLLELGDSCPTATAVLHEYATSNFVSDLYLPLQIELPGNFSMSKKVYFEISVRLSVEEMYTFFSEPIWVSENTIVLEDITTPTSASSHVPSGSPVEVQWATVDSYGSNGQYSTLSEALAAGENNILLLDGLHQVASTVRIERPVHIRGESRENTIIQYHGTASFILVVDTTDVTLSTLTLDANTTDSDTKPIWEAFGVVNCNSTTLRDAIVYGSLHMFAVFYAGPSNQFEGGQETIDAYDEDHLDRDNSVEGNMIHSNFPGDVLSFSLQKNGRVSNNTVVGGIISFFMNKDSMCNDNNVIDSKNWGIFVSVPAENNLIRDNTVIRSTGAGIKVSRQIDHRDEEENILTPLTYRSSGLVLTGNYINNTRYLGFEISQVVGAVVSNNTVHNVDFSGVYLLYTDNVLVKSNQIVDFGQSAHRSPIYSWNEEQNSGIFGDVNVTRTVISTNEVVNATSHGASFGIKISPHFSSHGNAVAENLIVGCYKHLEVSVNPAYNNSKENNTLTPCKPLSQRPSKPPSDLPSQNPSQSLTPSVVPSALPSTSQAPTMTPSSDPSSSKIPSQEPSNPTVKIPWEQDFDLNTQTLTEAQRSELCNGIRRVMDHLTQGIENYCAVDNVGSASRRLLNEGNQTNYEIKVEYTTTSVRVSNGNIPQSFGLYTLAQNFVANGTQLLAAEINNTNTSFQVNSIKPPIIRSESPSAFPSAIPSNLPTFLPSANPSQSKVPSSLPSMFPSLFPSRIRSTNPSQSQLPSGQPMTPTHASPMNDWFISLKENGVSSVTFTNGSATELFLIYNVTPERREKISIKSSDCLGTISPSDIITPSKNRTSIGKDQLDELKVFLDIDKSRIENSSIWSSNPSHQASGFIRFCVVTELMLGNTSVSFHETSLIITIDMSKDFSITAVQMERDDVVEKDADADVNYGVDSCLCTADNGTCDQDLIMKQNSEFDLCIIPTSSEVFVKRINRLALLQGNKQKHLPIGNGVEDALTTIKIYDRYAVVSSRIIAKFFEERQPPNIECIGTVSLDFASTTSSRQLRKSSVSLRSLVESGRNTEFVTKITLEQDNAGFDINTEKVDGDDTKNAAVGIALIVVALSFVVLSAMAVWKMKKRS